MTFMRKYLGPSAILLIALPTLVLAGADNFGALLAQVPEPPVTLSAASGRWQPGTEISGSQAYFDKDANAILAKLQALQADLQKNQTSFGGENAQDLQQKFASMSDQEKMAYAMQLAQKSSAAQRAAYTGANARALMRSQQNDVGRVQKGIATTKASKAMSTMAN